MPWAADHLTLACGSEQPAREAGARRFMSVHLLVPGEWTVQRGHDLAEEVEAALRAVVPRLHVLTHLEPIEDPVSFRDATLDGAAGI